MVGYTETVNGRDRIDSWEIVGIITFWALFNNH